MSADALLDPQDVVATFGETRPLGEVLLDLYHPNPTHLPTVARALAAMLRLPPTHHPLELLELVRAAQLDPLEAWRELHSKRHLPDVPPGHARMFRGLDRVDATVRVESVPNGHSAVLLGLLNGGVQAVVYPSSADLVKVSPQVTPQRPLDLHYPTRTMNLAFFAGAADTVRAVEQAVAAFNEALVAFQCAPFRRLVWAFRPLRWASRASHFGVLGPISDAVARAREALGLESPRVATVARHLQWDPARQRLGDFLGCFLRGVAEWNQVVACGAVVPPPERRQDDAPTDDAALPLAMVGVPFAALPNPYAPLARIMLAGALPRFAHDGVFEVAMPPWRDGGE